MRLSPLRIRLRGPKAEISIEKKATEEISRDSVNREVMIHGSFTTRFQEGSKKTEEQKEVIYGAGLAY
jgi:hypothetical protein